MQDFSLYLGGDYDTLLREGCRVLSELATAHEELAASQAGHENAYTRTVMATEGTVAERERHARAAALPLRIAVYEVQARIEVLRLELDFIHYLRDRAHAQRQPTVDRS